MMDDWVMWASEPEMLGRLAFRSAHLGILTGKIAQEDIERASLQVRRLLDQASVSGYEPTVRVPRRGAGFEGAAKEKVRLLRHNPSFSAVAESTNTSHVSRKDSYQYAYFDDYRGSTRLNIVARYPWREYGVAEKKEYLSKLIDIIGSKNRYSSINYIDNSLVLDHSQIDKDKYLHENLSVTKTISAREKKPFTFHAFGKREEVVSLREYMASVTKTEATEGRQTVAGMRRSVHTLQDSPALSDTLTGAEFLPEILL